MTVLILTATPDAFVEMVPQVDQKAAPMPARPDDQRVPCEDGD